MKQYLYIYIILKVLFDFALEVWFSIYHQNILLKILLKTLVSKCNAKRCVCCTHLCTKTTIASSLNGRQFSIINNNDMD